MHFNSVVFPRHKTTEKGTTGIINLLEESILHSVKIKKGCEILSIKKDKQFNISYNPDDEILVTVGVSEALDIALRAVLNPGDKVIYHEPCYVSYSPSIKLAHAVPIAVSTSAEYLFAIDPEKLEAAWEPGCKVLLLNFPTNPTGGVVDIQVIERIAKFAIEKDLLVISDEIYAELTFEGKHTSIASFEGMKERTIFLHGFSKAFAMTGFRIGYACGPVDLIEAMMKSPIR